MPTTAVPITWPLRGLGTFLQHPRLWLRPLLGSLLGWSIMLVVGGITLWTLWPEADPELGWWAWIWACSLALGGGAVGALASWLILTPLIMGFAYEQLSKRLLRERGCTTEGETVIEGVKSTGRVLVGTMVWRLVWMLASLICLIPPLTLIAPLVAQIGLAHIATIDGCDLALALQGRSGRDRLAWLKEHRRLIWLGSLVAAGVGALLAFTFVAWLLFMPMMFTGAAILVATIEGSGDAAEPPAPQS